MPKNASVNTEQRYSKAPPKKKPVRKILNTFCLSMRDSTSVSTTAPSPQTMLNGPSTRLERRIQTPAVKKT